MRNKINTIVMSMLLVLSMAISMFAINSSAAEATTTPIDSCDRIVEEYDLSDAESYINDGDTSTYPTTDTEGYIFAGWYTKETCTDDSYWGQEEAGDTVYALFVPSHILSVKAQVSSNLLDDDATNDGSASLRFVTTVDTLLYTQAGFELSYTGSDGTTKNATSSSNKVYQRLYAIGSTSEEYTEEDIQEYIPGETFCGLSTYFKACTVKGIGEAYYDTKFTVKPFWRTVDGSIVYGETTEKSVSDYFDAEEVWISSTGTDAPLGYGTYEKPYATLDYAIEHVKNNGTVHVIGDVTVAADATWTAHGKSITITNDGQDAKTGALTFAAGTVNIQDAVKFTDMGLDFSYCLENTAEDGTVTYDYADVYACGYKLEIDSNVSNFTYPISIYGGAFDTSVASTDLTLRAGYYLRIYGGGRKGDIAGDTYVVVGENVNASIDHTSHSRTHLLIGGCDSGTVSGDTHITVATGAEFNYIYGAGYWTSSVVEGSTYVDFSGNAMSIYGGSRTGTNGDTHVVVRSGEVYQVFGGCEANSMTGNTDVQILGGTVKRRIYGGCYNNYTTSGWSDTLYQVTGNTNVSIATTTVNLDTNDDNALCAISRYKDTFVGETGALIFQNDLFGTYEDKIQGFYVFFLIDQPAYHYLVKADVGGQVYGEGNGLRIIPDSGKVATVRVGSTTGSVIHYTEDTEKGSVCTLPALTGDTMEIYVVFEDSTPSDVTVGNYEAKIGGGYYATVAEAVAVANATSAKETVTVTVLKDAEIASDMEITGNVIITNLEDTNVNISRATTLTDGNMFSVASGATLNIIGTSDENLLVLDGKEVSSTVPMIHSDGGTLYIKNATLQNAYNTSTTNTTGTSGAIYAAAETDFEMVDSKLVGNTGTYGGAIRVASDAKATIRGCVFGESENGNKATKDGGAIYTQSADGTLVIDSQFFNNTAGRGGAVYNHTGFSNIVNSTFSNNVATGNGGGAIANVSSGSLKLTAQNASGNSDLAVFENNEVQVTGGGAINSTGASLTIVGYTFRENYAKNEGGAIRSTSGIRTIIGVTFIGNYTTEANGYGGAVCIKGTGATMSSCVFKENYTSGSAAHGGAVYLSSREACIVENPTYADNAVIGDDAEGHDIYIEGVGSGTDISNGLIEDEDNLGSGGDVDESMPF